MKLDTVVPSLTAYIAQNYPTLPPTLCKIILFGSFARGTPHVGSDMDIALVAEEPWDFTGKRQAREWFDGFDQTVDISLFYTTDEKIMSITAAGNQFDANYWIAKEGALLWQR